MCWKITVCILKIPDIISNDKPYCHIRPEHIILLLRWVNSPPACHTEDINKSCNTINNIPPAAIKEYTFIRCPPRTRKISSNLISSYSWFKIRCYCNKNINSNDYKWPWLKPFFLSNSPLILNHEETDNSDICCIKLSIMEPSVHILICLIAVPTKQTCLNCYEIDCEYSRNDNE